jgi:molybdopterin adenylyltransferase
MPIDDTRAFLPIHIGVLTISDTRTLETDTSGQILVERIQTAGHSVAVRAIVPDFVLHIQEQINDWIDQACVDAIITTGGTGVTGRDVTPEALEGICDKMIPGFGELFRMLSFQSIGTSTLQSRACAGIARGVYIFALPGSRGAVQDGWDKILKYQLDSRHKPCNFIELMPRLCEK